MNPPTSRQRPLSLSNTSGREKLSFFILLVTIWKWVLGGGISIAALGIIVLPRDTAAAEPNLWAELGQRAEGQYEGEGLVVTATEGGALLRCVFQRLEGRVEEDGLWLESKTDGRVESERFRIRAQGVGREGGVVQELPETGKVEVEGKLARYIRSGLTEEYSVSVDGVRQDFLLATCPSGEGELRLELEVNGIELEPSSRGHELTLTSSEHRIAYNRLHVEDAIGKRLPARFEFIDNNHFAICVDDGLALYPLRIDPTFSNDNWHSMGGAYPGANGRVTASAVDQSGNLYVIGDFTVIGDTAVNRIGKWDGHRWTEFAVEGIGNINLIEMLNNNLYAGGTHGIARLEGDQWTRVGAGFNGNTKALTVMGDSLYVGGQFTTVAGITVNNIAKWDGVRWSALDTGTDSDIHALIAFNGNLYAGGTFTIAGGRDARLLAKWDGNQWSSLGTKESSYSWAGRDAVNALQVFEGSLCVGGWFNIEGVGDFGAALWDDRQWSTLGERINWVVKELLVSGSHLYAGGNHVFIPPGGGDLFPIAKWDGSQWSGLGAESDGVVSTLSAYAGDIWAGGTFTTMGSVSAQNLARWNGSQWHPPASQVAPATNDVIHAFSVMNEELYVGGEFTQAGGMAASRVAKWDGSEWTRIGSSMDGDVMAMKIFRGELHVAGKFMYADGASASRIARWDGHQWFSLEGGIGGNVNALEVLNGNLYAGGSFTSAGGNSTNNIANWDGNQWTVSTSVNFEINAMAVLNDQLFAGGTGLAEWDGGQWHQIATSVGRRGRIYTITEWNGDIYAPVSNSLAAKWNGSEWLPLDPRLTISGGVIYALHALEGTLYAGGQFSVTTLEGKEVKNVARWDGNEWHALGSGTDGPVYSLRGFKGDLYVGGDFMFAGDKYSPHLARVVVDPDSSRREIQVETFILQGGEVSLRVPSGRQGWIYELQHSTNLGIGSWITVRTRAPLEADGLVELTALAGAGQHGFYRIIGFAP